MREIHINDIKPAGNFKEILLLIRDKADVRIKEAHGGKKYVKELANNIMLVVGIVDALEEGQKTGETWNIEENLMCLLYSLLIVIDCNQVAHTYLNNITEWKSRAKQLQETIDSKPEIYGVLKITE